MRATIKVRTTWKHILEQQSTAICSVQFVTQDMSKKLLSICKTYAAEAKSGVLNGLMKILQTP